MRKKRVREMKKDKLKILEMNFLSGELFSQNEGTLAAYVFLTESFQRLQIL
jgi:hypothetical protein